jgi:hypothetical protein
MVHQVKPLQRDVGDVPELGGSVGVRPIEKRQVGMALEALPFRAILHGPLAILLMLLSAVLVLAGIFLALASVSFWVEDKVGVLPPFYNLTSFGRYPITIYHTSLRVLLTWVLPYGFVAFYPATGFLRRAEFAAGHGSSTCRRGWGCSCRARSAIS